MWDGIFHGLMTVMKIAFSFRCGQEQFLGLIIVTEKKTFLNVITTSQKKIWQRLHCLPLDVCQAN